MAFNLLSSWTMKLCKFWETVHKWWNTKTSRRKQNCYEIFTKIALLSVRKLATERYQTASTEHPPMMGSNINQLSPVGIYKTALISDVIIHAAHTKWEQVYDLHWISVKTLFPLQSTTFSAFPKSRPNEKRLFGFRSSVKN